MTIRAHICVLIRKTIWEAEFDARRTSGYFCWFIMPKALFHDAM